MNKHRFSDLIRNEEGRFFIGKNMAQKGINKPNKEKKKPKKNNGKAKKPVMTGGYY